MAADMLFHSWADIGRVVLATAVTFALIVAILRVAGAQAIAQMSGYDMVATVTLGSVVATVAVTRGVTVSEGAAALLTLVGLQEVVRFAQSRWLRAHHIVRQPPVVLLWDGALLEDRLRKHDISADEVRAAIRRVGLASLAEVQLVVLENDGEWSVVSKETAARGDESAFLGLPIPGRSHHSRDAAGEHATPTTDDRLP